MFGFSTRSSWAGGAVGIAVFLSAAAQAQTVDPALAKSWDYMRQAMPGVPYELLKAACAEGDLMIYNGTWSDAQTSQVEHFRQHFPCINVRRFESEGSRLRVRFLDEVRANRNVADIIQDTDPGALDKEAEDGTLMKYVITNDKSYEDALKKTGYWYPLRITLLANAWNTNLVTDAEAKLLYDWKGVADPAWKGRASVVDAGGVDVLPWYGWAKMYGDGFIQKIGDLKPRIFGGNNPASASLASGDVAVLLGTTETGVTPLYLSGAPIRWALPEPALGAATGEGIPAKAPHPNAAKLYHEYAFTLEGYGYWQKLGGAPARIGYQDQRQVATESWYKYPKKFYDYDPADVTNTTAQSMGKMHQWVGSFH